MGTDETTGGNTMRMDEARKYMKHIEGRSGSYIVSWGKSLALEVCRTIESRRSATPDDYAAVYRVRDALRRVGAI